MRSENSSRSMRPSLQWARRRSTTYSRSASEARISGVWPPRPSRLMLATVSHAVDRTVGVLQRRRLDARALGDDLGADRHRRLLRRPGAEVEPDGRQDAGELLVGHALVAQARVALVGGAPAA